jgi:hypothetical protein
VISPTQPFFAQDNEDNRLILIKEITRGPEDSLYVSRLEEKIEEWVKTVGSVHIKYKQELPNDPDERIQYCKNHGKLKVSARIIKEKNSAAVTFRIVKILYEEDDHTLDEFRFTKALEPSLIEAENTLNHVLKTIVTPMIGIYMRATCGKLVLADCILPEEDDTSTENDSKRITPLNADKIQRQELPGISIHGLNYSQVKYICLCGSGSSKRLSENPSIRNFFDQVVYGDLETGANRVYVIVENHDGSLEEQRMVQLPQTDCDSKANELANQILQILSNLQQ